jgi:AcrR family transcriptional regulator
VAAEELARECGYHRTTLEQVAQRAGVTTGSIYSIFGSKHGLFDAVVAARLQPPPLPELADDVPLREALRAYGRDWGVRVARPELRGLLSLTLELSLAAAADARLRATDELTAERYRDALAERLTAYADARGEVLPLPAERLAARLLAALQGLGGWSARSPGSLSPEDFGEVAAALLPG